MHFVCARNWVCTAATALSFMPCPPAVPLARALLHTPIPKWAAEESKEGEELPDMQRFR